MQKIVNILVKGNLVIRVFNFKINQDPLYIRRNINYFQRIKYISKDIFWRTNIPLEASLQKKLFSFICHNYAKFS